MENWDYKDGKIIHTTGQDIEGLIESNKREFNASDKHYRKPMEKVASIDPYALYNWCTARGIKYDDFFQDQSIVRKFLADPDNAIWKTKNAKLKTVS